MACYWVLVTHLIGPRLIINIWDGGAFQILVLVVFRLGSAELIIRLGGPFSLTVDGEMS